MTKRFISALVAVLLLAAALTACDGQTTQTPDASSTSEGSVKERSRTVNIGVNSKLLNLDPHNFRDRDSELSLRFTYEPLLVSDHAGSFFPMLAKSWDISPDGTAWTFYLNEGISFTNGEPFNADTVVYNVERVVDGSPDLVFRTVYLPDLKSAEKVDEYTVKINFSNPAPLAAAGFRSFLMIPAEAHQEYGDEMFYGMNHIGTGPWFFNDWVDGQYSQFLKNPDYWNKAEFDSYFNEVYIRFITEVPSAIAAHIAGDIDAYFSSSLSIDSQAMYARARDRIELVTYPTNRTNWLGLSFKEGSIWHDENVRKAWDMAIDRQAILDTFLPNEILPRGFFAPGLEGHDPNLPHPEYDPEKARQLLADSSYDGRPFTLLISTNETMGEEKGLTIMEMVNAVGFNMSLEFEDFSVFSARQVGGDYDIFLIQTGQGNGVPNRALARIPNNLDNADYTDNEEMNALVRGYLSELDPVKRAEYARQANQMIFELKAPHISLWHIQQTQAVNYGLVGLLFNPDGEYQFHYVDWDPSKAP